MLSLRSRCHHLYQFWHPSLSSLVVRPRTKLVMYFVLFEIRVREREMQRVHLLVHWFTQFVVIAGLGQASQELRISFRAPIWVQVPKCLCCLLLLSQTHQQLVGSEWSSSDLNWCSHKKPVSSRWWLASKLNNELCPCSTTMSYRQAGDKRSVGSKGI